MSSIRPRVLILCLCAVFALLAESAFATHFRYGYMFWERDLNYPVAGMARVLVTVDFGGRWTYPAYTSVLPPPGFTPAPRCTAGAGACCAGVVTTSSDLGTQSCPNLNTLITVSNSPGELIGVRNTGGPMTITDFWGNVLNPVTFSTGSDTNMPGIPMSMLTNQILPTLDTFYARKQFYVIFNPATTTINVVWNGNARISQLLDANNDRLWRMSTFIDLRDPRVTRSPISTSTPIIPVFTNQQNVVMLPGTSFDNLATKFRLAATTESNLVNAFPAPPSEFSLNPNTGQVTFRPRMNGFYAVQFIITAYDPVTLQEKASIPLDVMFQAVIGSSTTSALTVSSPSTSSPPPYQAEANVPFSYSVQAVTTPPNAAYTVTISSTSAAPAGGFFAGGTCAANAPCTKTFNWTPTVNSTPSVICYTATVTNGPTLVTQSPQLCVQVNLSALATTLEALPASGAAGGGPITLSAKLTRTLDNSPLANRPVSFTFESDPNNPPWVKTTSVLGTDTVLTNAQGVATLVVTSTRAVPTPAPYRATFNAIAGELLASSSAVNVISTRQASTSLNAPVVQSNPLPTVGFPLSASAVLNRVFTDGGPFAVAQDGVVFTLTQPGGVTSQVAGSTTSTTGVSTATFPAPTSKGSYSMSAFFPGNDALIGPTQSSSTPFPVFERTQLSIPTTTATVNVPTLVQVTLKTLPGNVPMAFSTVNLQGSFGSRLLTLDANGNATTSVTFTSPGTQVVTASYSPTAGFTNRVGQLAIETDTQVINVATPQVTLMTVAPVATVAGSPTTFTAKLTDGGGAPIEGATIDFVVILGASLGSAQTGPDGVATISTVAGPSFNGGYRAVFNGMPGYQSTAANATYSVTPAGSSLSVINAPASAVVGQALAVEAQLMRTSAIAGPVAGATIAVTLDQSPAPVTVTGVTDGDGRVTVVFPPLVGRGNKTLSAAFLGDTYLTPATSSSSTLGVFQNIQLTVTPVTGFAGASIGLVASAVTLPDLAPVTEPLPVTFQADQYSAVSTLNNGTAFASVTITSAGTFSLTASTPAQNFFREATSNTETILVNKAESFLTPLTVPAMNLVGGTLNVSTTLSRSTPPAGPLMGAPVSFTLTGPAQFETSVTTEASGVAFAALPLTARGSFNLSAEYAGSPILKSTSRSATVDVFERTKITVLPNPGATAATPTSVSALLVAVPSNSPIAGQTVVFTTTAAGVGPATAVTDANGIATVQLTFAQASPFSVSASFDGASDHFANSLGAAAPEFDSGLITVLPLAATLSPLSVPSTTLVGNSVAASTTLTRADNSMPIEGQSITFSFTSPSGLTTQVMGVTDASGVATATFSTTERGLHSASAAFGGNTAVLPMTSPTAGISAYQPVALTLTAPPSSIAGQNVVFTASLRTIPGNAPVAGQTVSFASSLSSGTAVTDAAGNAMFTVATDNAGDVDVEASFSNTAAYFADAAGNQVASTASASVTVAKATTSLSSIAVNPNALVAGTITASAALTRTSAPVGAISGAPVAFVITTPSGATLNASAQTNEAGVATITFAAAERGIYAISASFAGTTALTESSAAPANTTAYQRTQLTATGAASANAGAPLTLSATLATVPGGAPLAGQTITFDFGGVIAPLNAVTDAFGIASVTIVAPSAGWIDANASFMNAAAFYTNNSGAIPPAPETATTGVTINEAATVLAAIVAPANTTTNSAVTASTVDRKSVV